VSASRTAAVGVVLPVHNEEDLLAEALEAIDQAFSHLAQLGTACRTAIVLDTCSDASAMISRRWVRELQRRGEPHQAVIARCRSACVGRARRTGAATLLRAWSGTDPRHIWLATTDADSRVPGNWLLAQMAAHEWGADVWAGRIEVEDWSNFRPATSLSWQASYDREAVPIHGANLGFNAQAYLTAGGFTAVRTGEDRALYRAIVDRGGTPCVDGEVRVTTSGRRQARAPMGFAAVLTALDSEAS
jgi:hypothetical protein